jgi:hypothetical protein
MAAVSGRPGFGGRWARVRRAARHALHLSTTSLAQLVKTHNWSKRTIGQNAQLVKTHNWSKRTTGQNAQLVKTHNWSKRTTGQNAQPVQTLVRMTVNPPPPLPLTGPDAPPPRLPSRPRRPPSRHRRGRRGKAWGGGVGRVPEQRAEHLDHAHARVLRAGLSGTLYSTVRSAAAYGAATCTSARRAPSADAESSAARSMHAHAHAYTHTHAFTRTRARTRTRPCRTRTLKSTAACVSHAPCACACRERTAAVRALHCGCTPVAHHGCRERCGSRGGEHGHVTMAASMVT